MFTAWIKTVSAKPTSDMIFPVCAVMSIIQIDINKRLDKQNREEKNRKPLPFLFVEYETAARRMLA